MMRDKIIAILQCSEDKSETYRDKINGINLHT